jgi:oxygen-independent coproporphyrinogen-3 oxidase
MITTSLGKEHEKAKPARVPESIYVHIPFCTHKCEFCDFAAFAGLSHMEDEYTAVLCSEIKSRLNNYQQPKIKTIFFGGGTPGLMSSANLQKIFQTLRSFVVLDDNAEVSLETTPHAVSSEKAASWKGLGINRVSIGIESFLDSELVAMGRDHSLAQALEGIELAAASGIEGLSLDFMYGLPQQNLESFEKTLDRAIELSKRWPQITHFSAYCLELSVNSALKSRFPDGHPAYPGEDDQVEMYHLLVRKLAEAGFNQYEVSNFAKRGFESRHNMTYWLNRPYFAFGVGAHRYVDGVRSSNSRSFMKYIRQPLADDIVELIDAETAAREALMLGLRMMAGIDLAMLCEEHGLDLLKTRKTELKMMQDEGLVQLSDGKLSLTQSGIPISNSIIATLI